MYGKTYKIRRRPSVVVLVASLAAIAIPAGQARTTTHDPASQPPSVLHVQSRVSQWTPTHDPASQPPSVLQSHGLMTQSAASILMDAAQEHGSTGFGNGLDLSSRFSKPAIVDYSHLPQGDRPSGITRRGI